MATLTLNISIPKELGEFLANNPDLSPSKIFQQKCWEIMDNRKNFELQLRKKDNAIARMGEFINQKELWEEFQTWKNN
ncbi:unnamed protein product [marine sediment metagenome]|uniref:Uncharacterized protein n=1 Tax=marine sediment metagenome TaxID=412755 RepID=X1L719_9ZZZZ